MKILLVDDHTSFCEGLVAAISVKRPEFDIAFESNAELVPTELLAGGQFELLILDVMMPGLGGVELVKHLNALGNFTPIIVMSSIDDPKIIQELFTLGVLGFIPKNYSVAAIVDVIESCVKGEMYIPEKLQSYITLPQQSRERRHSDRVSGSQDMGEVHSKETLRLTKRQVEILSLMDRGMSNQEMAHVLNISVATIKTHIHQLYTLLDVNNRVNCLRAAKNAKLR